MVELFDSRQREGTMADESIPDIFSDFVNFLVSDAEAAFGFRLTDLPWDALPLPDPNAVDDVVQGEVQVRTELKAVVRMTHAHAKALAIQMKKILKTYEQREGEIKLPEGVARRVNFQPEDWE